MIGLRTWGVLGAQLAFLFCGHRRGMRDGGTWGDGILPILVRPVRFERTTHGFEGHCSIQLSYGREPAARNYHAARVDTSWRPR